MTSDLMQAIQANLLSPAVLFFLLEQDFFSRFARIAYSTDIEVIRSHKF